MPNRQKIAHVDRKIESLHAALDAMRGDRKAKGDRDRLLAQLARLKAERTRLMLHQLRQE